MYAQYIVFHMPCLAENKSWIGDVHIWCFNCVKACSQFSVQVIGLLTALVVRLVRGTAMLENCGMKHRYHPTCLRKERTFFFVRGLGQLCMASTLSTWGLTSPFPSWNPRYRVSCLAHSHLDTFSVRPASLILLRTLCKCRRWSSQVLL